MHSIRIFSRSDGTYSTAFTHPSGFRPGRRHFLHMASRLALAAGCMPMTGCGVTEEPGLRIATNQWIGYELLYLNETISQGLQSEPLRVQLVELLSNSDSLQALAAGTVDGAGLTLDEVISARASGLDLKIVLVFDISTGADALLARPGITRVEDLKDMRVGVEQTGVGALMLESALNKAHLKASDVKLVSLTADQHLAAFQQGKLDALVTFEPFASQIMKAGGRRLFDSREIPDSIVDVLAISAQALQANPDTLRSLIARYFKAMDYLHNNFLDATRMMAPRLGLTPEAAQAAYTGLKLPDLRENRRLLNGSPPPLEIAGSKLAALMLRERLLARKIEVHNLIYAQALPEAES